MKNIANYISISRIALSIILIFSNPFSILFCIIYFYCGISDILDGYIARKNENTSNFGAKLDSIADIIFIVIAMIKILPILNLHIGIIICGIIIAIIKISNLIFSYFYFRKLVFLHTIANKVTGMILFIAPLIIFKTNLIVFEIIVCITASFAAIQEGCYIRANNCRSEL